MLKLREDQIQAFRDASRSDYVSRVQAIIAREFPDHYAVVGESAALRIVREAIALGESKGLCTRAAICRFAVLDFVFGRDAQQDGDHPLYHDLSADQLSDEEVCDVYHRLLHA